MQWSEISKRNCSISRALGVVGERWTLLILREAFAGARRFDDFRKRLGIARNVLTARLQGLVADGVLERVPCADSPGRAEYQLTAKGRDLYPVLVALLRWGDRWLAGDSGPPLLLVHRPCGCETTGSLRCSGCGEELVAGDVRARLPAGAVAQTVR
jgi:DNA-binding HxlR family transcriptional regulator